MSVGPLNRIIFIRRTKMRIDDIVDLVKFVEATTTKDQEESFESQLSRWRNKKARFADNRRKHRKIIKIHLTGSDHDEGELFEFTGSSIQLIFVVTNHQPARRDEEVSINDGRDVEHAIEISD